VTRHGLPIDWPEPFGLVMVEAIGMWTPVITCPEGAAVEVVEDGVTGALRESIDELAEAVETVRFVQSRSVPSSRRAAVLGRRDGCRVRKVFADSIAQL